jgi:hypothetical protein
MHADRGVDRVSVIGFLHSEHIHEMASCVENYWKTQDDSRLRELVSEILKWFG